MTTRVAVLDVGHGNAAVLQDDDEYVLVDAPRGPAVVDALREMGIKRVARALVSHADADHLGGMSIMLTQPDISIGEIRLNPDPSQGAVFFDDFQAAARVARNRHGTSLRTELTSELGTTLSFGRITVQVLHPPSHQAVSGVGGETADGVRLSAHSLSAVIRVSIDATPVLLLPGDLDVVGLRAVVDEVEGDGLKAHCLVFPHHGGGIGPADPREFAKHICEIVSPSVVAFSIGRGRFGTPRPEIVRGVREANPAIHIACTQLSERCAVKLAGVPTRHLTALPSRGQLKMEVCAGTLVIELVNEGPTLSPSRANHEAFIRASAPTPLCQMPIEELGKV